MRILSLLLLLCAGTASATLYYSATAHFKQVVEGVSKNVAEELLHDELTSVFGSSFNSVEITNARTSSLDSSSVLVDILIGFEAGLSRDTILQSLDETPLRLLRLSQGHTQPPSTRSSSSSVSILERTSFDSTPCSGHGIILPNATCVCDLFWNGDHCDQLQCFGGIAQDGRCTCPPGRFAEHCQPQICTPPMNDNLSLKRRSIVLAVNLKNTMARDLQYIIPDLGSTLGELVMNNADTYDHFVLYSYLAYGGTQVDNIIETTSFQEFNEALQEVAISKGDDRQPSLGALKRAINASPLIHPRSLIFLFADSLPSDSSDWSPTEIDQTEEVELIEQILAYGHRLVITLTDQPNAPLDPEDPDFESLDRVASTVHGDLIHTAKIDVPTTTQYYTKLLHQGENVYIKSRFTCGQEIDTVVEVDQGASYYYVAFSGTNKVQLFAQGAGAEKEVEPRFTVQNFVVFTVDAALTTIRVVTPTGSAPFCSFRVFVQSPDNVLTSFSHDANIDVGMPTATQGAQQHLTFFSSQPLLSHKIQMKDMTGNNLGTTKQLTARTDECSFTLQTDSDATCMAGPIHMKVTATNADGQRLFTRVVPAMCEKPAAREPEPWTCLNGGTVIDNSQGGKSCLCMRLFDGAHCESPQCHNGASRNQFPVNGEPLCLCQIGWAGRHCETLADCPQPADSDFALSNRQFVLVLQVSFSQNYIFDDVITALGQITTKYGSYVLVTYNQAISNGSPVDSIDRYEFDSVQGMVDQLNKVKYTYAVTDKQPIARAIMEALGNKTNRNDALVFVLTDSDDSSAYSVVVEMKKSATQAGAPLHIIRTQQFGDSCKSFDDKTIVNFARESGGVYVNTCAQGSSNAEAMKAMTSIASHPTTTQLMEVDLHYHEDCTGMTFPLAYRKNGADDLFVRIVSESTLDTDVTAVRLSLDTDDHVESLTPKKTLSLNTIHEWTLPVEFGDIEIDRFYANITVATGGKCAIFVYENSGDSLWYSYGEMEEDTIDRNANFARSLFPRVHIEAVEPSNLSPGADFAAFDLTGKQTYESSAGELRGNCSYEFLYPNEFACPTHDGSYYVTAAISHYPNIVQRTWFAYCGLKMNNQCVNGDWDGTKCLCYSNYEGDYCEIPQCIHGTYSNGVCKCEKKYIGTFCEYAMCETPDFWTAADERARDFRSITFIMELTNNAITPNLMFLPGLANLVYAIDNSGGSLSFAKQFNLITYDDENVNFAASSSVASFFISEFNRIITAANHKKSSPATTKAFTAIDKAMQMNVAQPNLIIAFVSASSSPALDEFRRMQNQHAGVQVNIIYSPPSADVMLPSKSPFYLYEAATYMSGGRVIPSTQLNAFYLPDVISSMVTEDVLLTAEGSTDCTSGYTSKFRVESTAYRYVVMIMGTGVDSATVKVSLNGVDQPYAIRRDLFSDSAAYSFEISSLWAYEAGEWSVTAVTTKGRCTIQARMQSNLRTEIGFVSDEHDDYIRDLPFVGNADKDHKTTRFALTVPTQNAESVEFTKASLYDIDFTSGKRTLKSTVAIGLRDYGGVSRVNPGCAYQYVSEPVTLSSYMSIVVEGYNKYAGESIQRTFIVSTQDQQCNGNSYKETGECICPDGFTGDSCDIALCANGGSPSGIICICTSGYTGAHCEDILSPTVTTTTKAPTTTTTPAPAEDTTTAEDSSTTEAQTTTTTPPTTTTTKPVCYPDATTYDIAMFIENSKFGLSTPEAAEKIMLALADTYELGVDTTRSNTKFMINGVNDVYFYGGVKQSTDGISIAITNIEDNIKVQNAFNLGTGLNSFIDQNMSELTAPKPFVVIFSGIASTDDASYAVPALRVAGYDIVGIAFTEEAKTYLLTLTNNVFLAGNDAKETAAFIVEATCAVKPRN